MNIFTNILGFTAGIVMVITMIPQVLKSYRTKSVKDLSFLMLFLYISSAVLWLIYGLLIKSYPVVIMDAITICIGSTQIVLKIKYGKKQ